MKVTRGDGRVPFGLIGAVALIAAAELGAFAPFEAPISFGAASWREARRAAAERGAVQGAVLCFGDSQVKCGLLPAVLEERLGLGRSAYNLAVVGGQGPSSLYLFERALRAGAKPRAVVVGYYPALLGCDLRLNAGTWPELLGPGECLDLLWSARDPKLAAPVLSRSAFPSLRRRQDVRASIRSALFAAREPGQAEAWAYRRNWGLNAGAHALAVQPGFLDDARPEPGGERWKCKPVNARYVRRFLTLADQHGVPVFWLLPTNSPALTAARRADGRDAAYERFVASLQAEFPRLTVIDPRPGLTDPSAFSDVCHLDRRGAVALSLAVADVLAGALSGRSTSRRVRLPAGSVAIANVPASWAMLEDVGQSASAIEGSSRRIAAAPASARPF